jgi:hypothetical protein
MIYQINWNYNTRRWEVADCPTWLYRECLRLDTASWNYKAPPELLTDRVVYVGY